MGSRLLRQAQGFSNRVPPCPGVVPEGGFRAVSGAGYEEIAADMDLLLDGLTSWQLAKLSCLLLEGYYLEEAFNCLGIAVLSPLGKAVAQGKRSSSL